jgi:hypothetical protein
MTRRVPVFPSCTCWGCPAFEVDACRVTRGYALWRTTECVADELAWRNVCAGLAMVAFEWRRRNTPLYWVSNT